MVTPEEEKNKKDVKNIPVGPLKEMSKIILNYVLNHFSEKYQLATTLSTKVPHLCYFPCMIAKPFSRTYAHVKSSHLSRGLTD